MTQVADQRFEHARRELELHELVGQLLADLERLRVLRAHLLDVAQRIREVLADRGETARGLFRIRAGIDCFFFLAGAVAFLAFFTFRLLLDHRRREIHLGGILRLRDDVGRVRVDEAHDDVDEAGATGLDGFVGLQQVLGRGRVVRQRQAHGVQAFLDALGDADFAFARQQLHRAHLAHVHAHRVGGAAELGVERGQRGGGFFDGFFVRRRRRLGRENALVVRCLFVHRDAHVVNRVDDLFDLFRIDDFRRQVIVHLRIREVTLFLAARDQQLELRLALFGQHIAARGQIDEFRVALLALLGFGRGGRGGGRCGSSRSRELLRGLELDDFSFGVCDRRGNFVRRLAFHERLLHLGMFLDMLAFRMRSFEWTCAAFSFEECAATAGFAAFFGSFLEAGAVGRLCFCVMRFRRQRRIEVRHRWDADGAIKVACGKGGAFYAKWSGLTKRKSPLLQRLPLVFDPLNNAKFGPKGSSLAKI